jgi:hypothetical protein
MTLADINRMHKLVKLTIELGEMLARPGFSDREPASNGKCSELTTLEQLAERIGGTPDG